MRKDALWKFPLELTDGQKTSLLETIELQDYRKMHPVQSNKFLLLCEVNMLEFRGMIGKSRDFTHGPLFALAERRGFWGSILVGNLPD